MLYFCFHTADSYNHTDVFPSHELIMNDITEYFIHIIEQSPSYDIAEAEFKRAIADDDELRAAYRQWCHEVGSSEKCGFLDFCEEYRADRNEIWNSLSDYDNDD